MNGARWPAVEPAICLILGTALAVRMSTLPPGPLIALAALGLALGRSWSRRLAFVALATLHGAVTWVLPERHAPPFDPELPVMLTVRLVQEWQPMRYGDTVSGWWATSRTVRIRQGQWIGRGPAAVTVYVGGDEAPPGDHVLRLQGYLRRRAGFAHGRAAEPGPWRASVKSARLVEAQEVDRLARLSGGLRRGLMAPLRAAAIGGGGVDGGQGAALLAALLLGDRQQLPESWLDGLRRLGLSHLLAVSGLHVALLLAPLLLLSRRMGGAAQLVLATSALVLYVLLVGFRPSLLRAAQMAFLFLATRLVRRGSEPVNSLAVATAVLVAARPAIVEDLGFQLTVAATTGILVLVPWWARAWPHGGLLQRSLQVSLAAQVATLPWVVARLGVLSPVAPLANLVAVPWTGVCLLSVVLVAVVTRLAPATAAPGLRLLDLLAVPFGWTALLEPRGPLAAACLFLHLPLPLGLLLATALAFALRRPARAALFGGAVLVWWALAPGSAPRKGAEVVLLDVGQGDAILLRDRRSHILVDGGGTAGGDLALRALLPGLQSSGVRRLDVAVLSHPDRDHCLGLLELSRFLHIGELWVPAVAADGGCAGELLERFTGRTRRLAAGDVVNQGGFRFEVLHPRRSSTGHGNRDSLVLRARQSGVAVLLTGDIDAAVEAALVGRYGGALRSDVLKVPHHGSRTSSSPALLETVGARVALLSAGVRNPYGHPSPEVVARYRRRSTIVLRTDRHGRVTVSWSNDGSLRLRTTGR